MKLSDKTQKQKRIKEIVKKAFTASKYEYRRIHKYDRKRMSHM